MKQYLDLLGTIIKDGELRGDRTGVGTRSIFGGQLTFDLNYRFPLVTIKKTNWKAAFIEMLWFLSGKCDNLEYLHQHGVHIWDEWAKDGELGPIYGVQWRKWPGKAYYTHPRLPTKKLYPADLDGHHLPFLEALSEHQEEVDQLKLLIDGIKKNPEGRRHIVTAWNPAYLDTMALPPCHRDFQCYVTNDGQLDLMMAIRSWDTVLGGPFNIAQYAFLTHLIAHVTGLKPRYLKINYGDAHIYQNHIAGVLQLLERDPMPCGPRLVIKRQVTDIDDFKIDDFEVTGYESHPFMKFDIAV